jgi:hypothetical protein
MQARAHARTKTHGIKTKTKFEISLNKFEEFLRREVLMETTMKSKIFWNVTPCSLIPYDYVSEEFDVYIFKVTRLILLPRRWRKCLPEKCQ